MSGKQQKLDGFLLITLTLVSCNQLQQNVALGTFECQGEVFDLL